MTRSSFIFKRSFQQIFKCPASSAIVVFALTVCTFAVLILSSAVYDTYCKLLDILDQKKLYYISFEITDTMTDTEYPILNELFGDDFPGVDGFLEVKVRPNGAGKAYSAVYLGYEFGYPSGANILSGRTYTDEELKSGASVVVLNSFEADGYEIGDEVDINGQNMTLIGTTTKVSSIPLLAAMKYGWSVSFSDIKFSEILTEEQDARFTVLAENAGGVSVYSNYDVWGKGDYNRIRNNIISLLIMLCVSGLIISEVIGYMAKSRMREFNIFKILGISGGRLLAVFYLPIAIMLAVSILLGYSFFKLSEPLQMFLKIDSGLGAGLIFLDFLIVLILLVIVTLPKCITVFRQDVKEGEGAL